MVNPGHTHPSGLKRKIVLMQNILCIWISVEVALAERPIIMQMFSFCSEDCTMCVYTNNTNTEIVW